MHAVGMLVRWSDGAVRLFVESFAPESRLHRDPSHGGILHRSIDKYIRVGQSCCRILVCFYQNVVRFFNFSTFRFSFLCILVLYPS